MADEILPLRIGVGIVVLNLNNQVFVGKRKDNPNNKWQMPQGGVGQNESFMDAMKRELYEETGLKNIEIIKELDYWMEYELPKNLVGVIWKGKYRGQKQKWFIVRFLGEDKEINLNIDHAEFIDWKWIDVEQLPNVIVDFKKHIYIKIVDELKEFTN